jgi:hypothetical protein
MLSCLGENHICGKESARTVQAPDDTKMEPTAQILIADLILIMGPWLRLSA